VPRHPLGDDVVVLDDQHLGHVYLDCARGAAPRGWRNGSGMVKKW
jgi:hypothetical protein